MLMLLAKFEFDTWFHFLNKQTKKNKELSKKKNNNNNNKQKDKEL